VPLEGAQYSALVAAVIGSAMIPTLIARRADVSRHNFNENAIP
jgi:hypothetical protein